MDLSPPHKRYLQTAGRQTSKETYLEKSTNRNFHANPRLGYCSTPFARPSFLRLASDRKKLLTGRQIFTLWWLWYIGIIATEDCEACRNLLATANNFVLAD